LFDEGGLADESTGMWC